MSESQSQLFDVASTESTGSSSPASGQGRIITAEILDPAAGSGPGRVLPARAASELLPVEPGAELVDVDHEPPGKRRQRSGRVCCASYLVNEPPRQWAQDVEAWITFLEFGGDQLPKSSFHLRPGERVTDPQRFYERLKAEIAVGPGGPRARGALQADLRRLQELFGRRRQIKSGKLPAEGPPNKPR